MKFKNIFKYGLSCLALIGGLMTINSINSDSKASAEEIGTHYTYNTGDWYWLKNNGNYMAQIWSNNNGGKYTITLYSGSYDNVQTYVFTNCFYFENIDDSGISTFGSSFYSGDSVFICEEAPIIYGTNTSSNISLMIFGYKDGKYKVDIRYGTDPDYYSWGGAYGGAAVDYDKLTSDSYTQTDIDNARQEGFEEGKNSVNLEEAIEAAIRDKLAHEDLYTPEDLRAVIDMFEEKISNIESSWNNHLELINSVLNFTDEAILNSSDFLSLSASEKEAYYTDLIISGFERFAEEIYLNGVDEADSRVNENSASYQAGQESIDPTADNQQAIDEYIKQNDMKTYSEYIDYGEKMKQEGIASVDTDSDNEYYYNKGIEEGKLMIDITSNDKEVYDAGYNQCKEDKKFSTKLKNLWNIITDFFTETLPGLFNINDNDDVIKEDVVE